MCLWSSSKLVEYVERGPVKNGGFTRGLRETHPKETGNRDEDGTITTFPGGAFYVQPTCRGRGTLGVLLLSQTEVL